MTSPGGVGEWEEIHLALTHSTLPGGLDMWACLSREERVDLLAYYTIRQRRQEEEARKAQDRAFNARHGGQGGAVDSLRQRALIRSLRERGTSEGAIQAFLRSGQEGASRR